MTFNSRFSNSRSSAWFCFTATALLVIATARLTQAADLLVAETSPPTSDLQAVTALSTAPAPDASSSPNLSLAAAPVSAPLVAAVDAREAARSAAVPSTIAGDSLLSIEIETGRTIEGVLELIGGDSRQQLLVTGRLANDKLVDLTRDVAFEVSPKGVVSVGKTGEVTPLADGRATITARTPNGPSASIEVSVSRCGAEAPINFANQVVPIFTKLSCNSGGCHGKASGQNGFRLSLLGFEPAEDFEHLVKEARGRRVFPSAPEQSLLLRKPTGESPHGGGARLERNSYAYRIIWRWIQQGMPYGNPTDRSIERIAVLPQQRSLARGACQQLIVLAHYTDGSTEDVTGNVQFEANNTQMAEVGGGGLVRMLDQTGDVAVMARYQGQVDVFRATVPLGAPLEGFPPARNFIDLAVFKKLSDLGLPPSPLCDDATFLRRVNIDIAGRTPTATEVAEFLQDRDPGKRDKLIETLLSSSDYADYFATKWNSVLRNKRRNDAYARGTYAFHAWIRENLYINTPYDELVRQILTASGEIGQNPPVTWYREVKDTHDQVEDMAQLFLGLRIKCAQCHHHPYEKWSQQDYYGLAAFFSQIGRKSGLQPNEERIYAKPGKPSMINPKTQASVAPTGLGDQPVALAPDEDPRQALADWVTAKENPYFAPALVNRYWKHFFSRGIVEPEDDMRITNPASNPELLAALAQHFRSTNYDLKALVRAICQSATYQLSAEPNAFNADDRQNYSRYYPKRLSAEVLLDAIDRATGAPTEFAGMPAGTRAVQLPDTGFNSYFLTVFGRPEASSACECERSGEANLAQTLHLLNSDEVQTKLTSSGGRVAQLSADSSLSFADKARELYAYAFAREPQPDELAVAISHLEKHANGKSGADRVVAEQRALEDILWALVNTKEFLFNH